MARNDRRDEAESFHHVYNRALARRTMFETRRDKRFFMAQLAGAVRRDAIRVISFSVLTTHYHLLLQSVHGSLASAMQRFQTEYSRYFNRTRRRDGPLARGRFSSKRIDCEQYFWAVIRYIDENAVQARLANRAEDYEFSSAHRALRGHRGWLDLPDDDSDRTAESPAPMEASFTEVIERRLHGPSADDPLDELLGATPERVFEWMRMKARLGDGTEPGQPVCHATDVARSLEWHRKDVEGLASRQGARPGADRRNLLCGLLRGLCGLRHREIVPIVDRSVSAVADIVQKHNRRLLRDDAYAAIAAAVGRRALHSGCFGVQKTRKKSTDAVLNQEEID